MRSWKIDRVIPLISTVVSLGLTSVAFQNCAKAKFGIDPSAKAQALDKENVFEEDVPDSHGDDGNAGGVRPGDDGNTAGGGNTPGNDGSNSGNPRPGNDGHLGWSFLDFLNPRNNNSGPNTSGNGGSGNTGGNSGTGNTGTGNTGTPDLSVNFRFLCSNTQTEENAGNLLSASAVKLVISNATTGPALCELTGDFKASILNTKKITFTPCANLTAGTYNAYIVESSVPTSDMATVIAKSLIASEKTNKILFNVNSNNTYTLKSNIKIDIVYDLNAQHETYGSLKELFGSTSETQALCEQRASPLIISLNSTARGISLTSPLDGIQFDILGENSLPKAHDKKQISWLAREEQEYYFITLPNGSGEVLGINELFGDNTRGPDGKFAANGYLALAKYDENGDNLITEDDAIYAQLRLWGDPNRDGIAQPEELLALKDKAISIIDLDYDKRYKEEDQYGNQTLMKSVVKTEDGKLHLVFDLWFRHLNITK